MTSKSLPSDPTETMLHAGVQALRVDDLDPAHGEVAACYRAMYDAAPPVRLTRTDPPTEPGWYCGKVDGRLHVYELRHAFDRGSHIAHDSPRTGWGQRGRQTRCRALTPDMAWYGPLVVPEIEE